MTRDRTNDLDDQAGLVEEVGADRVLVPAGVYDAAFLHFETAMFSKARKLYVWFELLTPGPYLGTRLYRAFNVKSFKGQPGRNRSFTVTRNGSYYREMVAVLQCRQRPDRLSPHQLKGLFIRVAVRTVDKDRRQRRLPHFDQYSVIEELLANAT
jgi:hypothetical protein